MGWLSRSRPKPWLLLAFFALASCTQKFDLAPDTEGFPGDVDATLPIPGGGDADGFTGIQEFRAQSLASSALRYEIDVFVLDDGSRRAMVSEIRSDGSKRFATGLVVTRVITNDVIDYRGEGLTLRVELAGAGGQHACRLTADTPALKADQDMLGEVPVVTNGLALHLDAARASSTGGVYPAGCTDQSLMWFDISGRGSNASILGADEDLCTNFGMGWRGAGSFWNPHNQRLGSGQNKIALGASPGSNALTVIAWVSLANYNAFFPLFSTMDVLAPAGAREGFIFGIQRGGANAYRFVSGDGSSEASLSSTGGLNAIRAGDVNQWTVWAQVAAVIDKSTNRVRLYHNGLDVTPAGDAILPGAFSPSLPLQFGWGSASGAHGAVSIIQVHSRALTTTEIRQSCFAQQNRFGLSTCR